MTFCCLCRYGLSAALLFCVPPAPAAEGEVLPFGAVWEWLMLLSDGVQIQQDPALMDVDFLSTWTTPAYDGPPFQSGPTPMSYGGIVYFQSLDSFPGTIWNTPSGLSMGTVYCRTEFTLPAELTHIRFEFLVDDGCILYVDGVRWFSRNMRVGATSGFREFAIVPAPETVLLSQTTTDQGQPFPSLPAGRHTLHLSVHNQGPVAPAPDLGFMLRVLGDLPPVFSGAPGTPSTDGTPRIVLTAKYLDPAISYIVEGSDDLTNWAPVSMFPAEEERTQFTLDLPATAGRKYFRLAR